MDPRVDRTRQHVLASAQQLMAEYGAAGVTFTTVARRARVSRNTLYRHWSTREQLLVDVTLLHYGERGLLREDGAGEPAAASVEAFLSSIAESFTAPGTVAALTMLISRAEHDPTSAQVLRDVADERQRALSRTLGELSHADFARIVGPLFFHALVARRIVDEEFVGALAAAAGTVVEAQPGARAHYAGAAGEPSAVSRAGLR